MVLKQIVVTVIIAWLIYVIIGYIEGDQFDYSASLNGKNILITGASSGIGEETAYKYASYGANVFISARRESRLQKVVAKCKSVGSPKAKFGYLSADMKIDEDRDRLVESALEFFAGDIDHLILNHAMMPDIQWWTGSSDQLQHLKDILNINVVAFAHLTAAALPSLKRTGGSIAAIGSIAGRVPTPLSLAYEASKFALDGFFSGLRYEFKASSHPVSITFCIIGVVGTDSGIDSFKKVMAFVKSPSEIALALLSPSRVEDAGEAIVKATTRRQGELYFPKSQLLWQTAVLRSIAPELLESVDLGFGG